MLRWFGLANLSQKMRNVGTPTKAAVNVPAKKSLANSKWAQQFAVSIGTKYGGATTGARFPKTNIREASGNGEFLRAFCCPGCHRSNTLWVQDKCKVVL